MTPSDDPHDIELELGADEVQLKHLVSAAGMFSQLINEVAKEYLDRATESVRWIVEVRAGCVRLPVRAEPASEAVRPSAVHEVGAVIVEGVTQLEQEPERPRYFSDKALEQAKALANLSSDELPVRVRNGQAPAVPITKQLLANVEKLLGGQTQSFGTVEGSLEALNIHSGRPYFNIYDALTGKAISCQFGKYVSLEDVLAAVGKRVAARGPITRKPNGEPVSIEVHELEVLPEQADLPTADDVLGIFKGYEEVDE